MSTVEEATTVRGMALTAFRKVTGLPVASVKQVGRDPETAKYTVTLDGGADVRVGSIDNLWSNAEFTKRCLVAAGRGVRACKPADWRNVIEVLVMHATEVIDTPGESFEDGVLEWIREYASSATVDAAGAKPAGLPFTGAGTLYVKASELRTYIVRKHNEQIVRKELLAALRQLGFKQVTLNYTRKSGRGEIRSTVSYYHGPLTLLDGEATEQ